MVIKKQSIIYHVFEFICVSKKTQRQINKELQYMQIINVLFQAIRFGMILPAKLLGPANFRGV